MRTLIDGSLVTFFKIDMMLAMAIVFDLWDDWF